MLWSLTRVSAYVCGSESAIYKGKLYCWELESFRILGWPKGIQVFSAHSTVAIVTCCYCSFCYHYHFPVSHSENRGGGLRLQSQIKTRIRIRIKGGRERMSLTLTHTHTHIAEVECQMRNINVRNFQDILHYSYPPLPAPLEQQEQQFFSACRVLGAHALLESPLWRLINGNN